MPIDTIPLILSPTQRGTGTGDRRSVNTISEKLGEDYFAALKRWGLANSTQPPGGSATGRGVHYWSGTGNIYSVFGNKIYSGTSAFGVTLAGSSGRCWFVETPATASEQILIVSDGSDNYHITTGDVIDTIDENDDPQYPTNNLACAVYLDAYILQAQASGKLWNTDQNDFDAWRASNFVSANAKGDALEAIVGQRNRVLAMGKQSIESYWIRGNRYGSPLLRIEESRLSHGIASRNTLGQVGDLIAYVGETAGGGDGGRSVWLMQGGAAKELPQPVVNRFLAAEGTSISSATAWIERVAGHLIYLINLSSADRSFVYDIDTGQWCEWESAAGGAKFPGAYATSKDGTVYVQDASNGRIYTFGAATYQDSGTTFTVTLQTEPRNQGAQGFKTVWRAELDADTQASGTATLAASDDDGTTWTTMGTFDLTAPVKFITDLGQYEGERMWRVTHAQNTAGRFRALRLFYDFGAY